MGASYTKPDQPKLEDVVVVDDENKPSRVEMLTRLLHEKSRRNKEIERNEDDLKKAGL